MVTEWQVSVMDVGVLKKQRNNSTQHKNGYLRRRTHEVLVFFEA